MLDGVKYLNSNLLKDLIHMYCTWWTSLYNDLERVACFEAGITKITNTTLAKTYKLNQTVYEFTKSVSNYVSKQQLRRVCISWTSKIRVSLLCSPVFGKEFFIITKNWADHPGPRECECWDLKLSEIPFYRSIRKLNLSVFVVLGDIKTVYVIQGCLCTIMLKRMSNMCTSPGKTSDRFWWFKKIQKPAWRLWFPVNNQVSGNK